MTLINNLRFNRLGGIVLAYYVLASVFALLLGIVQPATGIPGVIIQLTHEGFFARRGSIHPRRALLN